MHACMLTSDLDCFWRFPEAAGRVDECRIFFFFPAESSPIAHPRTALPGSPASHSADDETERIRLKNV